MINNIITFYPEFYIYLETSLFFIFYKPIQETKKTIEVI